MSKSNVERDLGRTIDFLNDIDRAHRTNDDAKLKKLTRDADDLARKLKHVHHEAHRD